ncbi:hypothetical protein KII95_02865 [Leuconostoc gelidum subsp. aenigmaticum]|uniref:DUF7671 family protein n=1 Tax=Leuconostoc gelidum TaxID=1244 RepID=UPI001C7D4CCB|nr:hypothetical protein [Leuconostoc gelidum]MBZ6002976.1 hypothetical protein [Leuconostoc gelidum subsp. aenigmaticum]MBZ6010684.1 hypothetical protein [Leuconostoc gelidum subsp. aenigmaticum]
MSDSKKYDTYLFTGVMVEQDASGCYRPKAGVKPNVWRTGKHTKGQFKQIGQVFLTEKGQAITVLNTEKLSFNKRHNYSSLQRWTSEQVSLELLKDWL